MSMTIFRSTWMREWVKRKIVRLLITNVKPWKVQNQRVIHLGENLKIQDYSTNLGGENLVDVNYFVPIHMASQGYWQAQDEMTNDTKI